MFQWVKEQAEVFEKDLTEFASVVKNDAKGIMKEEGMEAFEGDVRNYTESIDKEEITYLTWVEKKGGWVLGDYTDRIAEVLEGSVRVRTFHEELVPVKVTESDFWERYFYRVDEVKRDRDRRELIKNLDVSPEKVEADSWDSDPDPALLLTLLQQSREENKLLKEKVTHLETELEKYTTKQTESSGQEQPRHEENPTQQKPDWEELAEWNGEGEGEVEAGEPATSKN